MENQKQHFEELGSQLSHPEGETGMRVAEMMHNSNAGMILRTISSLQITDNAHVLELGHASCGFLGELLAKAENVRYSGLEISETMSDYCRNEFASLVSAGHAEFKRYDGKVLPYADRIFDFAFCVNTVYFWEEPSAMIAGLRRVLKPGGKLAIAFAYKSFMERLPFVNHLFTLYDPSELMNLLVAGGFSDIEEISATEKIQGKHGEEVVREYGIISGVNS